MPINPTSTHTYRKGDRIADEYEVRDILGAGGFGIVYLVYHAATRSSYALKTFRDDVLSQEKVRSQFRREASVWVALDYHPHIVHADRIIEFEDRLFVALEYVPPDSDGLNSLDGFLAQSPPDLHQNLVWAIQFCLGMMHAYEKGIRSHRDIKPANIMIASGKILKISDFGLAGALVGANVSARAPSDLSQGSDVFTSVQQGMGTPTHMPPEQFVDASTCDERSDIYSFGVVLYEMCTGGMLPFIPTRPKTGSFQEKLRCWAELQRMHSQALVPQTNSPLDPLIGRCLAKNPKHRYQKFEHLEAELQQLLKDKFDEQYLLLSLTDLDAAEHNNKGASLDALGEYVEALIHYDKALSINPQSIGAYNNKGITLKTLGRFEDAMQCYESALEIDSDCIQAWMNKGVCLTKLKRYDEAERCLDRALKLEPNSAGCWLNKGNLFLGLHRIEDARLCFEKCIKLNPLLAYGWQRLGLCHHELRHLEAALDCFDKAIEIQPTNADTWTSKATCLSMIGRNEDALACVLKAVAIDESSGFSWFTKANIEEALDREEAAVGSYLKVLSVVKGKEIELLSQVERRLRSIQSLQIARKNVADAERGSPRKLAHVRALDALADAYAKDQKFQQAGEVHEEAISITETELGRDSVYLAILLNNQGKLYHEQGKLTEAQYRFERAFQIIKNHHGVDNINLGSILTNLGVVYDDQGRHSPALLCLEQALQVKQQHLGNEDVSVAITLEYFAVSLKKCGRLQEAADAETEAQHIRSKKSPIEHYRY